MGTNYTASHCMRRKRADEVRTRSDSPCSVPQPALVLVLNQHLKIVGYTAGNDVFSRDIENENPLYLPQAKMYDDSCAVGPGIVISDADSLRDIPIEILVERDGGHRYRTIR